MMNRVKPALFSSCFSDWVRSCWPDRPDLVAIDGRTLRRSHDRSVDQPALHLVSAFATTSGLVLGQQAVSEKSNELRHQSGSPSRRRPAPRTQNDEVYRENQQTSRSQAHQHQKRRKLASWSTDYLGGVLQAVVR
jgi:hypothetical protein